MNLPNKLTVLRMCMVPFFVAALLWQGLWQNSFIALVLFAAASLTDLLDGQLARKNGQVTTFGKFLDPLADKLLVVSAMICFIDMGLAHSVAVLIVIAREFVVSGIRLVAAGEGTVIAANIWGKVKTVAQMVVIIGVLLLLGLGQNGLLPAGIDVSLISNIGMWLVAALTVISGATYVVDNIGCINTTK